MLASSDHTDASEYQMFLYAGLTQWVWLICSKIYCFSFCLQCSKRAEKCRTFGPRESVLINELS